MAEHEQDLQIGAYFYPLTQSCEIRNGRARQLCSSGIGTLAEVPNELVLAETAGALFDGHDQPRLYGIPYDTGEHTYMATRWDDADWRAFMSQVLLAKAYGVSYFVLDSYRGLQQGQATHELAEVTHMTNRTMRMLGNIGFKYARMETMERTRAVLPIPTQGRKDYFFAEPGRAYDITPEAAHHLVDNNIKDWLNPNYLNAGAQSCVQDLPGLYRPYVPILMPNIPNGQKQAVMRDFIGELLDYAFSTYGVVPYLVGVMRHSGDLEPWLATEVDAITDYLQLPITPSESAPGTHIPPVQYYDDLMDRRESQWRNMIASDKARNQAIIPSVPVGWDASPRGEPGYRLEAVSGIHPYTPLVTGSTAARFSRGLQTVVDLTYERIQSGARFVTIWAWNEVTEGGALLPRIFPDGTVDTTYLEAVRDVIHPSHDRSKLLLDRRLLAK